MTELTSQELALHMGCECKYEIKTHGAWHDVRDIINWTLFASLEARHARNIRPILRPISDMTEEEANEYLRVDDVEVVAGFSRYADIVAGLNRFSPIGMLWLARHGFDVLELLENGRAIQY